MFEVNSTESLPSSAPVSASSIHTTAPQVVCVTSYTTMLAFATRSARTLIFRLPAASHHSLPVQIDLQTYLATLQEATWHLQPVPLSAISLAPCSSSMPFSLVSSSPNFSSPTGASSTHSAASATPSSFPGGSLSFPSFIATVCAVLGAPFVLSAFLAGSVAGSTTPTPSVITPMFPSAVPVSEPASPTAPSSLIITPSHSLVPDLMSAPVGHRFYQNWLSKFTWVNTSTLLNSSLIHSGTMSSLGSPCWNISTWLSLSILHAETFGISFRGSTAG